MRTEPRSNPLHRHPRRLKKAARTATLYVLVAGIAVVILAPIFFLGTLSFMSDFEAYNEWPLPLLPTWGVEFGLRKSPKGYLLSVRKQSEDVFESVVEGRDPEALTRFVKRKTNCRLSPEQLAGHIRKLEHADVVRFTLTRDWLANYRMFFRVTRDAPAALWRSVYTAVLTIVISLGIGALSGYAFARYAFRGRNALKIGVLFVRMFPGVSVAIPMVMILGRIGLYDNPIGLSLVYAVGQIGLTVWITASIFLGIPVELEEAAQVFGAGRARAFWHVTLPLALPGLAACAMYAFIASWNETIQAIVLTQFHPTFPVVVYQSLVGAKGMVQLAAAGGVVMAIPAVLFTLLIRKYILRMWGGVTV